MTRFLFHLIFLFHNNDNKMYDYDFIVIELVKNSGNVAYENSSEMRFLKWLLKEKEIPNRKLSGDNSCIISISLSIYLPINILYIVMPLFSPL